MRRQDKIYKAINKHYEDQGKELVDIVYSIVNEMWTISIAERYAAYGNRSKIRVVEERMTNEQVDKLIKEDNLEDINSEHIRYIIKSLDREIARYEDIVKTLDENHVNGEAISIIVDKIEYIDSIIDRLEREI